MLYRSQIFGANDGIFRKDLIGLLSRGCLSVLVGVSMSAHAHAHALRSWHTRLLPTSHA